MSLSILLLALVAQETDWPERTISPTIAVRTFVSACWRGLRSTEIFETEIQRLRAPPLQEAPTNIGRRFTSPELDIVYSHNSHCWMRFRVETYKRAMELADDLGVVLGLRTPKPAGVKDDSRMYWRFRRVPIDRSFYALWAYVREPHGSQPLGPVEVEFAVSHGSDR